MTETLKTYLNDSKAARWTALILIALMMFFGYMFVEVLSPLQSLVEHDRGWSPSVFGTYASAEYILNVCGFLILAGIILDKSGIRFTGTLSASMMFLGGVLKYIGISDWFQDTEFNMWLGSWWTAMPGSAKMVGLLIGVLLLHAVGNDTATTHIHWYALVGSLGCDSLAATRCQRSCVQVVPAVVLGEIYLALASLVGIDGTYHETGAKHVLVTYVVDL